MNILGSIFIMILLGYSFFGGFILFAEYSGTSIDPEQKDHKKSLQKLIEFF